VKAFAVIGAGFGDEGKGRVVDFLADRDSLVVRFNGGANAAHTVQVDGVRRVFHHFPSGTLKGAKSLLSEHFVVNPMLFMKEALTLPVGRGVFIHQDAYVTTPYDMIVNQAQERARGSSKHGSCGVGLNETVTRCETFEPTRILNIRRRDIEELTRASREYSITRLPDHEEYDKWASLIMDDVLLKNYVKDCERMILRVDIVKDYERLTRTKNIIFEGAQGLLLDEDHPFFPHVTRSRTGLTNVREICEPLGIEVHPIYVTRTYMTRHGAGPFPTESPIMRFDDPTNVHNEWQGSLRFGRLDFPLIDKAIRKDLRGEDASLAVTCLDQHEIDVRTLEYQLGLPVTLVSHGAERSAMAVRETAMKGSFCGDGQ
jgi:adenylosuccinate synthase